MATDRPLSRTHAHASAARRSLRAACGTLHYSCTLHAAVCAGCMLLLALGCAHVRDQRRSIRRSVRLHRPP